MSEPDLSPAGVQMLVSAGLEPLLRDAQRSVQRSAVWIQILGQTFIPWLSAPGMEKVTQAIFGALVGRHAAKQVAAKIQEIDRDLAARVVWMQKTPFKSTVVGGSLPVGTGIIPRVAGTPKLKIGPVRIAQPMFMRLIYPPQPWKYRTKEQALSVGARQRAKTAFNPTQRGF